MQSVTSEVQRLPKKSTYISIDKSKINENSNYELLPTCDCFDPNI
jgi:hypothetical protein